MIAPTMRTVGDAGPNRKKGGKSLDGQIEKYCNFFEFFVTFPLYKPKCICYYI